MSKKSRANKSNFADGYTGDLATPIELPALVGCLDECEAEFKQRLVEQQGLKFGKLFDWYKIDPNAPDAGMFLALKLAMAHVPGMQIRCEPRKRGRKPSWKNGLGIELVRDVAALRKSKKVTYQQAIAELRMNKEKPWGGLYGSQPHHSPSRSTQGGTTLSAFVRTTERVAIVATRKGSVRMGLTDENSRVQN